MNIARYWIKLTGYFTHVANLSVETATFLKSLHGYQKLAKNHLLLNEETLKKRFIIKIVPYPDIIFSATLSDIFSIRKCFSSQHSHINQKTKN